MITKCFRSQNRDMQKFLWNLDNLNFSRDSNLRSINYKSVTLATQPWVKPTKSHDMVLVLKRLVSWVDWRYCFSMLTFTSTFLIFDTPCQKSTNVDFTECCKMTQKFGKNQKVIMTKWLGLHDRTFRSQVRIPPASNCF